jgi:DNA-binding SARP family transcriptional activator
MQRDHALLNLMTLAVNYGEGDRAIELAHELSRATLDPNLRSIADVSAQLLNLQSESDLEAGNRRLRTMAHAQRETKSHHFAVTMLNLALNSVVQDRVTDAVAEVSEAVDAFGETSSFVELTASKALLTSLHLRLGQFDRASGLIAQLESAGSYVPNDAFAEVADAADAYGSHVVGLRLLARVTDPSAQTLVDQRLVAQTRARMALRLRDPATAGQALDGYPHGSSTVVGGDDAVALTRAHLALVRGDRSAENELQKVVESATRRGFTSIRRLAELLLAASRGAEDLARTCTVVGHSAPWHLTFAAEEIIPFLDAMSAEALGTIRTAASLHQDRWRMALRQEIDGGSPGIEAPRLLEQIGERGDVVRLRRIARAPGRRHEVVGLGKALARRLAERVYIEDQGRVSLQVGTRVVLGSAVRRKVLAMLSFLITRPDLSATRDQVLEALWPDLDPEVAVNSLNQTVYFLRRVIEEDYSDDLSPGYVHHDSDVVWLDPELITSRSVECRTLIRELPSAPSPDDVERLTLIYRGRFALDFEYEEWAAAYRDTLHATYLEIVEHAVLGDFTSGHYDRGIRIARRALDIDPTAEQIEICLLRLYRVTGAHSAAAEQYAHYASVIRDEIGVEPPPLEAL